MLSVTWRTCVPCTPRKARSPVSNAPDWFDTSHELRGRPTDRSPFLRTFEGLVRPSRMARSVRPWLWLSVLAATAVIFPSGATCSEPAGLSYPLDEEPRTLGENAPLPCEARALSLVAYAGEHLRYQKPVRVHPAFRRQLAAFERIVMEVARQTYGRAPSRVVHLGGYNCRRMRRYPTWVSEHALGNAIDIAGFDFAPARRHERLPEALPKALRRGFQVRVLSHWEAKGEGQLHSRFLRALAQALIDRPDVFHVVLGPAWPGHKNHFHLDHAPYRVVEVF